MIYHYNLEKLGCLFFVGVFSLGSLVLYPRSAHSAVAASKNYGNGTLHLKAGQSMQVGSGAGSTLLVMQGDGYLVAYLNSQAVWASNTVVSGCSSSCNAEFQADGNFVVYKGASALWSSHTFGMNARTLVLQNSAPYLKIVNASGQQVWTGTHGLESVPISAPIPTASPIPSPNPPSISVKDFGAVGDAVADDQLALQNAFDAAQSQGKAVMVPKGIYRHSGILTVNGVVVFGAGNDQTVIRGTTYNRAAVNLNGTKPALINLTIEGTGGIRSSDRGGNGIYVFQSKGYLIQNCHVMGSSGAGIMTEQGSGGKVLNNLVESTGADGIYSTEGTEFLEVAYNKTIATGDDAISFTSYNSAAGFVHDITVHGNTVTGNTQSRSITVNGGYNIQIQDNYVSGGTAGISVGATTAWGSLQNHDVSVTGNTIKYTVFTGEGTIGGGALHLYNDDGGTDYNIIFSNNDIFLPAHDGIFIWGTDPIQATIHGNSFYMVASHPVFVNADGGATGIDESANLRFDPSHYSKDKIQPGTGVDPLLVLPTAR